MTRWATVIRSVAKDGSRPDENQDAAAFVSYGIGLRRLAISDGATNAFDSGRWAGLLAEGWTTSRAGDWTSRRRARTLARLADTWMEGLRLPEDAPWYVRARAERGAYATLLGADVSRVHNQLSCRLAAVGDSNAFVVKERRLVRAWPLRGASEFGSFPDLIGTEDRDTPPRWQTTHFTLHADEVLIIATDAVAAYLLGSRSANQFEQLVVACQRGRDFSDWVTRSRTDGMNNDDATVVVLRRVPR